MEVQVFVSFLIVPYGGGGGGGGWGGGEDDGRQRGGGGSRRCVEIAGYTSCSLSEQITSDLFGQKMSSSQHMKEHGVIVTKLHQKIGVVMIEFKDIIG